MTGMRNERFFPATPDETFAAVHAAANQLFKVKGADQFSRSVTFTTPMSGFSWGANISAQVIPVEGGSYVRVVGSARMATNVTAGGVEARNTNSLLDAVSARIQHARAGSAAAQPPGELPKAGWFPDTERTGALRWWDGTAWTEHRHHPDDTPAG